MKNITNYELLLKVVEHLSDSLKTITFVDNPNKLYSCWDELDDVIPKVNAGITFMAWGDSYIYRLTAISGDVTMSSIDVIPTTPYWVFSENYHFTALNIGE